MDESENSVDQSHHDDADLLEQPRPAAMEEEDLTDGDGADAPYGDEQENADLQPLGIEPTSATDRMSLSEQERNLAISIREVIANATDVDPVSDFMCAQLAIIDGDNTDSALERVYNMQCFREEYGILDTAVHGKRCFEAYVNLMPGLHLCFVDAINMDTSILVYDNTKFRGSAVRSEEDVRAWMGGTYYTLTVLAPDFQAIRSGAILVAECEGYNWKSDMDFKSVKRIWSEIAAIYPVSFQKIKYFNSPTTMNLVASMLKPFLPTYLRDKIEFGCQFHTRLDQAYLVPTPEEANTRIVDRVEAALRRRYENEQTFKL